MGNVELEIWWRKNAAETSLFCGPRDAWGGHRPPTGGHSTSMAVAQTRTLAPSRHSVTVSPMLPQTAIQDKNSLQNRWFVYLEVVHAQCLIQHQTVTKCVFVIYMITIVLSNFIIKCAEVRGFFSPSCSKGTWREKAIASPWKRRQDQGGAIFRKRLLFWKCRGGSKQ